MGGNLMTDIPDLQVALIVFGSASLWFCGFSHGKWYGIQKAEKRFAIQQKALRAAKRRENPR
jgi:hypothetical protein